MTPPVRPPRRRLLVAAATVACVIAGPATVALLPAEVAGAPVPPATFERIDVDTTVSGASFSSVGSLFPGEQNIVTSGYGPLDSNGRPLGGGTLQYYRSGGYLTGWTKTTVFGPEAGIIFPNATSIEDVDGDGDHDLIVPSGYFFGTTTAPLNATGAISWWENRGPGRAFTQHSVIAGQAASYHGVQYVDLDGDGIKDIVTVAEGARSSANLEDDVVETQFFKGSAGPTFAAPVPLAPNLGGSQPVVHDVDGDADLDIITAQYFRTFNDDALGAGFLWLENADADGTLSAADFTPHTIARFRDVGMGFQIRPVPGFREPGTVSWIGTNHVNRCSFKTLLPIAEQVFEFIPGADPDQPWEAVTLSAPATPGPECPETYDSTYDTFSDQITSRSGFGQGAPGVFGYGDLDGDGDVDLAVSGDGDRRLWWIENGGDGTTTLHRLTAPGEHFGQAGGAAVVDLDRNGTQEMVFSSFDRNTLAIWARPGYATPPPAPPVATPVSVTTKLKVGPASRTVRAGAKATWTVRLTGAVGGPRRTVSVVLDPKRGKDVKAGTLRLGPTSTPGVWKGKVSLRVKKAGRLVVRYRGTTVSTTLSDTAATGTARVKVRR